MTPAITLVLTLIAVALVFFAFELIAAEVVALGLLLAFIFTGILTPEQAFAGFGSETVMMILGLLIMTSTIARTGVMNDLSVWVQKGTAGKPMLFLAATLGSATVLSSVMSNTAVTALLLPVVIATCQRTGAPLRKHLLPLAFASILAGSMTLIGTSTNLVVSGLMQRSGLEPLGMFEMSPVGILIVLVGLPYLFFVGSRMLGKGRAPASIEEVIREGHYLTEVLVLKDSPLAGKTLGELRFSDSYDLEVVKILREGEWEVPARASTKLREGDNLLVEGLQAAILKVKDKAGIQIKAHALQGDTDAKSRDQQRFVEALVLPRSTLLGQTLKMARFRERYGSIALGIRRHGENLLQKISEVRLQVGDMLLLSGSSGDLRALEDAGALRLIGEADRQTGSRSKAVLAVAIFLGVMALGVLKVVSLPVAALSGAFLVFATRCAHPEEIYRDVEWKALILIACMLSVGTALHVSGTDQYLGSLIAKWSLGTQPYVLLGGLFLLTAGLSQPLSNQAAAALVLPVAIQAAAALHLDPRPFAMTIAFAASCSFLTPLEPSCLMVYGPGGYSFRDFFVIGLPLTLVILVITVVMVPFIWPLSLHQP